MTTDFTLVKKLANVKAGEHFTLGGYEYKAQSDAVAGFRYGFLSVTIDAVRRHPQMPSGWELATVNESIKVVD